MKWSWKLGEFRGIGVYMHATFLILIAYEVSENWSLGLWEIVEGVLFVLAIFACVVLHEFGHALTAAHYGIKTRDITLLPIGGVARLERMPDKPIEELWVTLAGPAVNVVIALILFLALTMAKAVAPESMLHFAAGSFWVNLLIVNVFLVVFNMLPAFPMDGGRVVRALLAMWMDYVTATRIASNLGKAMALLFGLYGLYASQPILILIAVFVWIGAAKEASMVKMRSSSRGITVDPAMSSQLESLSPTDSFEVVVGEHPRESSRDYPR